MRFLDDDGVELNAKFDVEAGDGCLVLVLESAGGKVADGAPSRNSDYVPALRLLLTRLAARNAVLADAFVVSKQTEALSEEDRRIFRGGKLDLAAVTDMEEVRKEITSAQGKVGIASGDKPGNNRKRIALHLEVPGYAPGDARRLKQELMRTPTDVERLVARRILPRAEDLLRTLVGADIPTKRGEVNTVLRLNASTAVVRTKNSPEGQPVPVAAVQHGLDLLAEHGEVHVTTDLLGHRSSFIAAVLAQLPGASFTDKPFKVVLGRTTVEEVTANRTFGELDVLTQVKVRAEQTALRKLLVGDVSEAGCALCGQTYPVSFLIAAHVKKRSVCTDDERRDLKNVAMLACVFGCDALYEKGWVTVAEDGRLKTATQQGSLKARLDDLKDRHCPAHTPASEPYFAWHRKNAYREA